MKITKAQIEEWKIQHFAVFQITGENNEVAFISFPKWHAWKLAVTAFQKSESKYVESLLTNCWLGGDEAIKNNIGYFSKIKEQLDEIIVFADVKREKVENHYVVTIKGDKDYDGGKTFSFKLKPQTREMLNIAERNAENNVPFSKNENLLKLSFLDDAKKVFKANIIAKNPYYYIPLLTEVDDLYEKKMLSIKKL